MQAASNKHRWLNTLCYVSGAKLMLTSGYRRLCEGVHAYYSKLLLSIKTHVINESNFRLEDLMTNVNMKYRLNPLA